MRLWSAKKAELHAELGYATDASDSWEKVEPIGRPSVQARTRAAQPSRTAQRQAEREHSRLTVHKPQPPLGFGKSLQGVAELTDQLATPAVLRSMGSSVDSSRLRANTGWPRTTSSPKLTMYLGSSWHSRPKRSAWGWHKLYILLGRGAG